MGKISKKRAEAEKKIEAEKLYSLEEAMALVKEVNIAKYDASVDLHVRRSEEHTSELQSRI